MKDNRILRKMLSRKMKKRKGFSCLDEAMQTRKNAYVLKNCDLFI